MPQKKISFQMRTFHLPENHPSLPHPKIGVLILHLGTPDDTSFGSMRRYYREFLSDKRVIDYPRWFWLPILYGIILNTRPGRKGRDYDKIWDQEANDSPLRVYAKSQAKKLEQAFGEDVLVDYAFRYANPSTKDALERMKQAGVDRIVALALYPHYSSATTATGYDAIFDQLKKMKWQPSLITLPPYHDNPAYVESLAKSIDEKLATIDWEPDLIVTSYHGAPERYLREGDPYHCHCFKTTRLLGEARPAIVNKLKVTFQSRFGPEKWLQPYTDKTLESLPSEGIKKVLVICPGFSVDNLETLEEINMEAREEFLESGGENFDYIPCLNDSPQHIDLIQTLCAKGVEAFR